MIFQIFKMSYIKCINSFHSYSLKTFLLLRTVLRLSEDRSPIYKFILYSNVKQLLKQPIDHKNRIAMGAQTKVQMFSEQNAKQFFVWNYNSSLHAEIDMINMAQKKRPLKQRCSLYIVVLYLKLIISCNKSIVA